MRPSHQISISRIHGPDAGENACPPQDFSLLQAQMAIDRRQAARREYVSNFA
jgi:hypothetical protein